MEEVTRPMQQSQTFASRSMAPANQSQPNSVPAPTRKKKSKMSHTRLKRKTRTVE